MNVNFHPDFLRAQQKPIAPTSMKLILAMLVIVLVGIIISCYCHINIISPTTGRIIPEGKVNSVRNATSGLVEKVLVADGSFVKKGQPLVILKKDQINADIRSSKAELSDTVLRINALSDYINIHDTSTLSLPIKFNKYQRVAYARYRELQNKIDSLSEEIEEFLTEKQGQNAVLEKYKNQLPLEKKKLSASEKLNKKGFVSDVTLLDQKVKVAKLQSDIGLSKSKLQTITTKINNLNKNKEKKVDSFELSLLEDIQTLNLKKMELDQRLIKLKYIRRKLTVLSPISGVVQEMTPLKIDNYIDEGDLLLKIVPDNTLPIVEVKIPSKDIGFIHLGQNARVKLDAFPYTRYGSLPAIVVYISKDSILENNKLYYPAHLKLEKNFLSISGKKLVAQLGMSVKSDIITGDRPLIDYFIAPIKDNLDQALIER